MNVKFLSTLVTVSFFGIVSFLYAAEENKMILMLVTGADKMANGKPTGLWLEEFAVPYNALVQAGYAVDVVTPKGGAAPIDPRSRPDPSQKKAWASAVGRLEKTKSLSKIKADDYVAIFIPGGHGVMFDLVDDPASIKLIESFHKQGKPVAAVCHGPAALVKVTDEDGHPLVTGKKMTAFTDSEERAVQLEKDMPFLLETRLRGLGANVETRPDFTPYAVSEGNLITGQNPASSGETVRLLLERLTVKVP